MRAATDLLGFLMKPVWGVEKLAWNSPGVRRVEGARRVERPRRGGEAVKCQTPEKDAPRHDLLPFINLIAIFW
jgi:hypothetical protein